MRPLVLFDVNYLCHRAHHSTGQLSYGNESTGVLFGVMKEIQSAKTRFAGHKFVFCFDHGHNIREEFYPAYKESRRKGNLTEAELEDFGNFQNQVHKLNSTLLRKLGYNNVFYQEGYEADDIIAKLAIEYVDKRDIVIYGDDKDLYQLLSRRTSMYKPRTGVFYLYSHFKKDYGIEPRQWAKVKAICGCGTDDVLGVDGVGEVTALHWVRGLPPKDKNEEKRYDAIRKSTKLINTNMELVCLPYEGTKLPKLVADEATDEKWDAVAGTYGMTTLGGLPGAIEKGKPKPILKV